MYKKTIVFTLMIVALNFFGLEAKAIDVPQGIITGAKSDRIVLSWEAVKEAERYEIQLGDSIIYSGKYTSYTHEGLTSNTDYSYRIRAISDGKVSSWSEAVEQRTSQVIGKDIAMWLESEQVIEPRHGAGAVSIDNKIYILGGYGAGYCEFIEVYDQETKQWVPFGNIPKPVYNPAIVANGKKIYIIGGYHKEYGTYNSVYIYDVESKKWTEGEDIPTPRSHMSAVAQDNKIYVIGGYNDQNGTMGVMEIYDIETDSWTKGKDMPTKRSRLATVIRDNVIYVFGGFNTGYRGEIETYNLETEEWEKRGYMPIPKHSLSVVNLNGRIFLFGGYNSTPFDTVEEYKPETNEFIYQQNLNKARYNFGVATTEEQLLIIGGTDEGKALGTVEYAIYRKPDPPENIQSEVKANEDIAILWDKVDEKTKYELERDSQLHYLGFDTTFIDEQPLKNMEHTYRVRSKTLISGAWSEPIRILIWGDQPAACFITVPKEKSTEEEKKVDETQELKLVTNKVNNAYTIYSKMSYNPKQLSIDTEDIQRLLWKDNEIYYSVKVDQDKGKVYLMLSQLGKKHIEEIQKDILKLQVFIKTYSGTDLFLEELSFVDEEGRYIEVDYVREKRLWILTE